MGMLEWAKNEVAIASKRERGDKPESEWDYGAACYDSAMKAFESLLEDGHSGMSIGFTKAILNRLIDGNPLTAIEDTPGAWYRRRKNRDGSSSFQCKRMSSLFKKVAADGTVSYSDVNRQYCIIEGYPECTYHNGLISKIYNEMYPITMPYMPNDKPDVIVCDQLLTDRKNGDFDTIAILYIKRANGERVDINRYFKETDDGFEEISAEEYREREKMDEERRNLTEK